MVRTRSNTGSIAASYREGHEARTLDVGFQGVKSGATPSVRAREPKLAVDSPGTQVTITTDVATVDLRNAIQAYAHGGGDLSDLLRVNVVKDEPSVDYEHPDVAGRYTLLQDALCFAPLMPFERSVRYRAIFDPRRLGRGHESSQVQALAFSIASAPASAAPEVLHIYPSSESLPENLLRFYIRFSNSMQRGFAEKEIVLLDADGATVADALYRAPVELWDRAMRILTVLLDPGRLKRAVGPNRELGPPLKAGGTYTLAIGTGMLDSSGHSLASTVVKRFHVTNANREPVNIMNWAPLIPAMSTREALTLTFPSPLDWALLSNSVAVFSIDGREIPGRIVIDQVETRWAFSPTAAWAAGRYYVRVASGIEDVCGNNTLAAFDTALLASSQHQQNVATRRLGFEIA
jgi:hypothetical protein